MKHSFVQCIAGFTLFHACTRFVHKTRAEMSWHLPVLCVTVCVCVCVWVCVSGHAEKAWVRAPTRRVQRVCTMDPLYPSPLAVRPLVRFPSPKHTNETESERESISPSSHTLSEPAVHKLSRHANRIRASTMFGCQFLTKFSMKHCTIQPIAFTYRLWFTPHHEIATYTFCNKFRSICLERKFNERILYRSECNECVTTVFIVALWMIAVPHLPATPKQPNRSTVCACVYVLAWWICAEDVKSKKLIEEKKHKIKEGKKAKKKRNIQMNCMWLYVWAYARSVVTLPSPERSNVDFIGIIRHIYIFVYIYV